MRLLRSFVLGLIVALVAAGFGLMGSASSASAAPSTGATALRTATNYNWIFQGTVPDPGTRYRLRTWKSRSYLLARVRVYRTDQRPMDAKITYTWTRPGRKTLRTHTTHWNRANVVRLVERKRGYTLTVRWYALLASSNNVVRLVYRGADSM